MTEQATPPDASTTCWCCGHDYAEAAVVRLGSRPEVAVCLDCAHHLRRRAREQVASGPSRRLHRAGASVREQVVRRGWHRSPVIGSALRRLSRLMPW